MRLDVLVMARFPTLGSKTYIQYLIQQGNIAVNGKVIKKPGTLVQENVLIDIEENEKKYVCRAGYKLAHALDYFSLSVKGLVALDAGLSTGGFTDCLLQKGVDRVYGVDVGIDQVHEKIKKDNRVIVMEKTNLRELKTLSELVDVVTLDLSFISVLKVIESVNLLVKEKSHLIILIKPQFEAGKEYIGSHGVIKDEKIHQKVIKEVCAGIEKYGWECRGVLDSPLLGGSGNKEFLAYFYRDRK